MKLPNIYTVLEKIEFEKEAKELETEILRLQTEVDDTKFNREQIVFSLLQKFYQKIMELSE
jgi:hypothetical protein